MRASKCHLTRSLKWLGSMPVERISASIHCSSVNDLRASNSAAMSILGIWIGLSSVTENGEPFWSSSNSYFNVMMHQMPCLLYTSDAADDLLCVDLGGRRIIK